MNSSTTTAGAQALASQYNNLRKDVIVTAWQYAVTTWSANAYVLAIDAQYVAYTAWDNIVFQANFANTWSCTINVNSLGAKTLKDMWGSTLWANAILSWAIIYAIYNGTDFICQTGVRPTTSNRWQVEMATDAEALAQTDQERYVNSKQVAIKKNWTLWSITANSWPSVVETQVSSGVLISMATIGRIQLQAVNAVSDANTAKLQTSPDNATWSNLYTVVATGTETMDLTFMMKEGLYYRIYTQTLNSNIWDFAEWTLTYTT